MIEKKEWLWFGKGGDKNGYENEKVRKDQRRGKKRRGGPCFVKIIGYG